jgi:hypothetical protein
VVVMPAAALRGRKASTAGAAFRSRLCRAPARRARARANAPVRGPPAQERATKALSSLLSAKPEGEARLLAALVNKLGDPSRKVASNAGFLLGRLLEQHPAMKPVVVREVGAANCGRVCVHVSVCARMCVCVCVRVCVCLCTCGCMRVFVCVCVSYVLCL